MILLVAASAATGACNVLAPAFYIVHGPPRTEAVHKLSDVPTVVFVDDRRNAIPRQADGMRRAIADRVSRDLMVNKVLATTIRPQDAISVSRSQDRHGAIMPIDAIGEAVGAAQIIYVQMVEFRESPDGFTPRPEGACEVRVIDVQNDVRVFPAPDAPSPSHMVRVALPAVEADLYRSNHGLLRIDQALAEELGNQIGKLFYAHETKELGGQLKPR
jgi:hypothetical protein